MASSRPVQSVSTSELYNRWAKVYDSDGNILQAIDDQHIPPLLSSTFGLLSNSTFPITITELGCGTGRNTLKLLRPRNNDEARIKTINALDLSSEMLNVARSRIATYLSSHALVDIPEISFLEYDATKPSSFPKVQEIERKANILLSTLVLEHLPLPTFFATVRNLIAPPIPSTGTKNGGFSYLLVTNMHAEMGRIGQAGFVDEEQGIKVRGESFNYEVDEVIEEGKKWGFELVNEMGERAVGENDLERGILGERGRKWIGVKVWFGCVMKFVGGIEQR